MLVQVGKFGDEAEEVKLSSSDSVEDALSACGISHNGERILVNGVQANLNDELEDGDVVNVVTSKEAAGTS